MDSTSHCHQHSSWTLVSHGGHDTGTEKNTEADCILYLLSSAFLSKLFRHPEHWTLSNSYEEHVFRWFNNISGMYDSNTALFCLTTNSSVAAITFNLCSAFLEAFYFPLICLFSGPLQMQNFLIYAHLLLSHVNNQIFMLLFYPVNHRLPSNHMLVCYQLYLAVFITQHLNVTKWACAIKLILASLAVFRQQLLRTFWLLQSITCRPKILEFLTSSMRHILCELPCICFHRYFHFCILVFHALHSQ